MANLSNGRHGKLDGEVGHGIHQLVLVLKGLILLVRRPAVFCDKRVHICCDEVTAKSTKGRGGSSMTMLTPWNWLAMRIARALGECLGDKIRESRLSNRGRRLLFAVEIGVSSSWRR